MIWYLNLCQILILSNERGDAMKMVRLNITWLFFSLLCIFAKENTLVLYKSYTHFEVYQDMYQQFYIRQDGKIIHKELKFLAPLYEADGLDENYLQILDTHNTMHKVTLFTKEKWDVTTPFGMEEVYEYAIKRGKRYYKVFARTLEDVGEKSKAQLVAKVPVKSVDSLFFSNKKEKITIKSTSLSMGVSNLSDTALFYSKAGKYGYFGEIQNDVKEDEVRFHFVRSKESKILYDDVTMTFGTLRVKKEGLWGFYKITRIKYKTLDETFDGYLARFALPDGRKGYVSDKGQEYFDLKTVHVKQILKVER